MLGKEVDFHVWFSITLTLKVNSHVVCEPLLRSTRHLLVSVKRCLLSLGTHGSWGSWSSRRGLPWGQALPGTVT